MMTLRERNKKVIEKHLIENKEIKELRNKLTARFGVDPVTDAAQFPFAEGNVSLKKLYAKLEEADSASYFPQFLRAGLNQIVIGMYKTVPVSYADWCTVVSTDKDTEIFAPNQGVAFPSEIGRGEKYPEVGIAALDLELKMKKFGSMHGIEVEFANDDKSGTLLTQASTMGEYLALLKEVYVMAKLNSVSGQNYLGKVYPTSETKPTTEASYPWSTALVGGGANRPAAFGALNQGNIQAGVIALMAQKNLQGIPLMVQPKRLLISPHYKFDSAVLLNSSFYPSGAAAAGAVGGMAAINPMQGILDVTTSRFMFDHNGVITGDSKAWYIVDDSKPWFIMCERTPVSVEQEQPNSGDHFSRDILRFKASTRFNADALDPRFAWKGSDGSI